MARMSMTEIMMLYLVKSQEATNMLFNAKFYQMYVVDRVRDSKEPGFNGKHQNDYKVKSCYISNVLLNFSLYVIRWNDLGIG